MVQISSVALQTLLISSYGLSLSGAFSTGSCHVNLAGSAALSGRHGLAVGSTKTDVDINTLDEASINLIQSLEKQMEDMVMDDIDEECLFDPNTGKSVDPELCEDPTKMSKFKNKMRGVVGKVIRLVRSSDSDQVQDIDEFDNEPVPEGELLEQGWEKVGIISFLNRYYRLHFLSILCTFTVIK